MSPRAASIVHTAFRPLPLGCPAIYAAHVLATGVHAVPVVDHEGAIVRIVTQADIVRYLASNLEQLPSARSVSLGDLGLERVSARHLVVARFEDRALDVFVRMRAAGCSAVPVLDRYGSLASNLSVSDGRAIAREAKLSALQLPVSAFFHEIDKAVDIRSPSIYCRSADSVDRSIRTLAATRIHQVYFVDLTLRPTGILRVADLLRALVGEDV